MPRLLLAFGFALTLSACCSDETWTHELMYNSPFYEVEAGFIDTRRANGWDCQSEGIRNAFGAELGRKYTCVKCV